jgi:hypothetical protein
MEKKRFPKFAKLKNVSKLPFKKRWTSNFELLENNKVLFVDADVSDLKPGLRLEGVIRRLDYEGKDGLILYEFSSHRAGAELPAKSEGVRGKTSQTFGR